MNKVESKELLSKALTAYRAKPYSELVKLVESKFSLRNTYYEEIELKNKKYQIRINVFWDDKKAQTLRVVGSIDDGGLSAMIPVIDDFLLGSDGKFINE